MGWGHMVRKKDERLPKRAETKKQGGCRQRGRLKLRWEDCLKRDLTGMRMRKGKKKAEKVRELAREAKRTERGEGVGGGG